MMEYMPYFFTAVAICSAARSSASSQLMASHSFVPRSPTRFMGCSTWRGL